MNKKRIAIIVVILGIVFASVYVTTSTSFVQRIKVEGKPVPLWLCSLVGCIHPEQTKVDAEAWWEHNPYPSELETEWQIYIDVRMVKLDVNQTYYFLDARFQGGYSVFGSGIPYSEGDVLHMGFSRLSHFELRDGKIDVELPVYVMEEKVVEGLSFWIDHLKVGEIEFSVEVEGQGPPQFGGKS